MAGPAIAMAQAKANAKKGIANVVTTGEDYPWICACAGFVGGANYTTDVPTGVCPYDKNMGCQPSLLSLR